MTNTPRPIPAAHERHDCRDYTETQVPTDASWLTRDGKAPAYAVCMVCDRSVQHLGTDQVWP